MYDLVIKNGTIVTAHNTYMADVAVSGEKIVALGNTLSGKREVDATGKLVTPGAIDIHVHLEMPIGRFTSTDDFYDGTRAAAFGGTTTIVDFVERQPHERMVDAIAARRAIADSKVLIDYALHMTLGPNEIPILDQVREAYDAGCTSFKLYMAYGLRLQDGELFEALTAVKQTGGMSVVHAENWDIICTMIAQNLAAGRTQPRWHPRSRPARMEAEATGRVIDIATLVGTPLHIFHVSSGETVARIAAARAKGLPITGETCPQYLFLTWDAYDKPGTKGTLPVCSPPIRAQAEQDALWQALSASTLQAVTTDHCPFTYEEKATGLHDYSQIPGGVPSIEMRFAALYHKGVRSGLLSLNQWVALCCTTPAKIAGLKTKGDIEVGLDADLVIFDPEKTVTITPETLHETARWTLYDGLQLTGWPETTISRGEIIINKGQQQASAGRGRFIKRD
ncbi:MAG: dihydropyrimidinase [Chloroflexi bacterium]|nr:dihydropyrimidinase [Chloroflexota bacterium]